MQHLPVGTWCVAAAPKQDVDQTKRSIVGIGPWRAMKADACEMGLWLCIRGEVERLAGGRERVVRSTVLALVWGLGGRIPTGIGTVGEATVAAGAIVAGPGPDPRVAGRLTSTSLYLAPSPTTPNTRPLPVSPLLTSSNRAPVLLYKRLLCVAALFAPSPLSATLSQLLGTNRIFC